ncbi:MAG: ATP-binding protein, partial [Spirochaetota bacterium]
YKNEAFVKKNLIFPRPFAGDDIRGRALTEKRCLYSNLVQKVPAGHMKITRTMAAPLIVDGRVLGEVVLGNKEKEYSDDDCLVLTELLQGIAPLLKARMERDTLETERKILQEQLIRNEQLAVVGKLSTFIAHEINSPIQGISTLLDYIMRTRAKDDELVKNVGFILDAFERIRATVSKLLNLGQPGNEPRKLADINTVIEDTVFLSRSYLQKNSIQPELDLDKLPYITASRTELAQLFMNLINNSVEALTGWKKRRSTGKIRVTSKYLNGRIVITVEDSGPGIDKDEINRVFEPFYSSKKSSGIGLTICRSIVENLGGTITVDNSPLGGALFTLTFPVEITGTQYF